ncbi:GTP-binding protein [Methanolobus bombayensis]|uniref:GTP-binding protein n=1 Tax=Methanolobus bombayensis TaxID=38023 RepID=UPI001AEB189A|nr:GTP-binding protein [Methanolobus bombayensis]MBP1908747.1 G3E family GTPase [Methanolobus bombayensis]
MKIIIVSGFLGSGKTTSIIRMGNHFKNKGYSVAVLVNDIGDVGVDGQVISNNGLKSKEIPRGCICCTLKYALEANISLVQAQFDPDILLIEPTGVAFPLRVKEQIEKMEFGPEVSMGPIISLIDGSKFGELMEHSGDAIIKQVQNADIVVLNKQDLLERDQLAEIKYAIKGFNPDSILFTLSMEADDGSFNSFMDEIESSVVTKGEHAPMHGISDSCNTVCDDEFDHFNVGSYAGSYEVNSLLDGEAASKLVLDVMHSVRNGIIDINPRFLGHLKMFLHTGSVGLRASVTSYKDQPKLEFVVSQNEDHGSNFTVFAAVTDVARDNLADVIENVVISKYGQFSISV